MKDKCIICGEWCKSATYYDGWNALCSEKCLEEYFKYDEKN